MIDNDADVNCKDKNLFTPLHSAAASGQVSVVKILLDHCAKVRSYSDVVPGTQIGCYLQCLKF